MKRRGHAIGDETEEGVRIGTRNHVDGDDLLCDFLELRANVWVCDCDDVARFLCVRSDR